MRAAKEIYDITPGDKFILQVPSLRNARFVTQPHSIPSSAADLEMVTNECQPQ